MHVNSKDSTPACFSKDVSSSAKCTEWTTFKKMALCSLFSMPPYSVFIPPNVTPHCITQAVDAELRNQIINNFPRFSDACVDNAKRCELYSCRSVFIRCKKKTLKFACLMCSG